MMKRLTTQDIQELSLEQVEVPLVKSEAEMELYYGQLQNRIGTFITQGKAIGKYSYYSWQAEVRQNYSFEGRMAIPSVRFYFVTKSQKGIHVDIDGQIFTAKQGEHNVFFCKEECLGRDIFLKNDTMEVITIAISEQEFAQMAQKYPDSFMTIYKLSLIHI